MYSGYKGSD
jgi:hAT family C-terminal dimerisation region